MDLEELSAWLRLHATPGIGNRTARQLLATWGLPQAIFSRTQAQLGDVVGPALAHALCHPPPDFAAHRERTWQWLQEAPATRRVLTLGDDAYPAALLDTDDPPLLLYALGHPEALGRPWRFPQRTHCLAVVGSRNPTPQGVANARQFALALADAGMTIVSGMALGIDGAAHEGALEGAGARAWATLAVVGTGLDRVYPRQHRVLAHRIAQQGLLLSEYPLGTPPLAANFPRRNRIISGLCGGTLVVEAALQSGSLITAGLALEQGREVFAIPGSIHATQARGCHALIKQGAKLVESAQDILEELQPERLSPPRKTRASHAPAASTDPADPLLDQLGFDPVSLDDLQARTGLDTARLQAQLMELELAGDVARMPGGVFQRIVRA